MSSDNSQQQARDHLWMHFTRHSAYDTNDVPTIVRGDGAYIYDAHGKRYLDGLAGLFVVQAGHGRTELAEAAAKQAAELAFFPLWSYAHPGAIDLAARLAEYAPGDLNRVFFTTGGGEAVESAWKLAKQYFKLTGKPTKHKVISRAIAYHGTPQGALSITGLPGMKAPFEPLVPSTFRVPNTNFYRAAETSYLGPDDERAFGQWAANRIAEAIEFEGPDTVAAVFLEPVQNSGGCFPPPPGYFERVREICDEYDVLLVSDEVICAFGRLGHMFAAERYGYQPDIVTCAKGLTSGYSPLGAMIATDRLFEPFSKGDTTFQHGYTFGGHPVSTAVAMANLDIFEREQLNEHVLETEGDFRATLEKLKDLPLVGDVRGDGYFYGIELVKDRDTKQTFDDDESERLLRGFLSGALFEAGLYCRADDRGDPVVQLAPPLICDQAHFDEMESILRDVLTRAESQL
ncbi:MAG TPA: aspartate aminotransferase family protein [Marmoricola sp.]